MRAGSRLGGSPPHVECRDFGTCRAEPRSRAAAVGGELRLAGGGSAEVVTVGGFTGSPSCLRPRADAAQTGAAPSNVARALAWVQRATAAFAAPGEVLEWVPDPRPTTTGAGRTVVHLYQQYRGIPVFEAMRTVVFAAGGGALHEVTGDHVPLADGLPLRPELDAGAALATACRHLAPALAAAGARVSGHPPRVLATPGLPARPTMLHKLPFEDPVAAHLTFFDLDGRASERARLAWFLSFSLPGGAGAWEAIVEATGPDAGRLLWSRDLVRRARPARGDVWPYDPGDAPRRRLDLPLPLAGHPPLRPSEGLPDGFPPPWVDDRGTAGNNARVRPATGTLFKGELERGVCLFVPADASGLDQRVLNAFYWSNRLHDLFWLLGFDEARGNFQHENFSGAPLAGDRVEVRIGGSGASFILARDGTSPRLSLGDTAAGRPTALSADVVIHEYSHGVTNRLVGGGEVANPMLQCFQSEALDEGTCDWLALTVQNHARLGESPPRDEKTVFGAWAADDAVRGLRPHPYGAYPHHFGDLAGDPTLAATHAAGQVWCAALLEMNRRLGDVLGDRRHGHEVGWQIVVDAFKQTPRTPLSITYLHSRDRVYETLEALAAAPPPRADGSPLLPPDKAADCRAATREAFAAFGMGAGASGGGPGFEGAFAGWGGD